MQRNGRLRWACAAAALMGLGATPGLAQDDGPSLLTGMIERAQSGETGPRSAKEAIRQVRRAVFRVQTYGPGGTIQAVGGGFLVSADGLAIVRASTLPDDGRGLALLEEDGIPLGIEVVAVDDDVNLALVRLRMPAGGSAFPHVELVEERIARGSPAWAVGFDRTSECRLAGIGGADRLPLGYAVAGTRWLILAGEMDAAVCEPIINRAGRLIGVTTGLKDRETGEVYALAADHVAALLSPDEDVFDEGAGLVMADPVAPGAASRTTRLGVEGTAPAAADSSRVVRDADVSAAELRTAVRQVPGAGAPLDGPALLGLADRLLPLLAGADEEDDAMPQVLAELAEALDGVAARGAGPLSDMLGEALARRLPAPGDAAQHAGRPILAVGVVLNGAFFGLDEDDGILVECGDHLILVTAPRLPLDRHPAAGSGVFIGGLFTGYTRRGGEPLAVVRHGFIRRVER